jgi:RNA polymerase sigma factor (sigma-70 family)
MAKPRIENTAGQGECARPSELTVKTQRISGWFQRWQKPIRRFLRARGRRLSDHDLDDIAQEVFLRLLRYDSAELIANPQGYLFTIAANVATEWSVRAYRRWPHSADWLEEISFDDPAEVAVASEWTEHQLLEALTGLSPRAREILRLYFDEELTHAEIASQLGVSRRIVKRDLIASYERLRTELSFDVAAEYGARSTRTKAGGARS